MLKNINKIIGILCMMFISIIATAQSPGDIKVVDVIDGDTLKAVIVGFPDPLRHVSIRIMGIDSPESRSKCPNEKARANLAKAFVQNQFKSTKNITLKNLSWDKYGGRILAEVFFDGQDIAEQLVQNQLAVPYYGEKKVFDWCSFQMEQKQ